MILNLVLGISLLMTALLMIFLNLPLMRGRVGPNHVYGMRIRKAFESKEHWYRINAYGGKLMILWALPLLLIAIVCFFVDFQRWPALAVVFGCSPIPLVLIPAVQIYRFAKKL